MHAALCFQDLVLSTPRHHQLEPDIEGFEGNWRHEITSSYINLHGKVRYGMFVFKAAESFSPYCLGLLARRLNLPPRNILWHALTPMVIVVLAGNVHFEALLICFLLFCFYYLFARISEFFLKNDHTAQITTAL